MGTRGSLLDPRTDIYSLGLVLYEMITGTRPFIADTAVASLLARLQAEAIPARNVRPEIPQTVSDLVMKAVAKEREARFSSADEMRLAIEGLLGRPTEVMPLPTKPIQAPRKSQKGLWAAVLAGIASAAVGGWLLVSRRAPAPTTREPAAAAVLPLPAPAPAAPPAAARPLAEEVKPKTPVTPPAKPAPKKPASIPTVQTGTRVKTNPEDGLEYVWIPPGSFSMGCSAADQLCANDERPAHQVTLTKGFWLGKTEVPQAAFQRVIGRNPSQNKGPDLPVDSVPWPLANAFCKTAGMRLPTEAEWEYAARGGIAEARYGGLAEIAWYFANSDGKSHPVAQKQPNPYGLYDMLGNLQEWTADWFGPYTAASATDPHGPAEGQQRIVRGGYWGARMVGIRASHRVSRVAHARGEFIGVRCAGD
jgi:formylglycine-generating enzyme required for sulfatase activity